MLIFLGGHISHNTIQIEEISGSTETTWKELSNGLLWENFLWTDQKLKPYKDFNK